MSAAAGPGDGEGWYVYGVAAAAASDDWFPEGAGVDPSSPVTLVVDGSLAAIANRVSLAEFGEEELAANLRDPAWLESKARAHEAVLEATLEHGALVPFRFGTIFRTRDQVVEMLRGHADLEASLDRLRGTTELGVKAFLDPARFDAGREQESPEPSSGRAYLVSKQRDRRLAEERASFKVTCAQESFERLAAAAEDARSNPLQRPEVSGRTGEMVLNAAYLVRTAREDAFREALEHLEAAYAPEGVDYELTGPWPPYNFVAEERPS
jgi:Gas vesicle synthesis protein GvpL/GvpF